MYYVSFLWNTLVHAFMRVLISGNISENCMLTGGCTGGSRKRLSDVDIRPAPDASGRRLTVADIWYTGQFGKLRSSMPSFNDMSTCQEQEDAASIYDEIQEHHDDDLNDQEIYLEVIDDETKECDGDQRNKLELPCAKQNVNVEVLGDETEGCDQDRKPEPPALRPVTTLQDVNRDHNYEGLKEKKPDNVYLHVPAECGENTNAADENRDQSTTPQRHDNHSSTTQDQDHNTQQQSPDQTTQPQE